MTERVTADQRILVGTAATLVWQPLNSDGEPAAPNGVVTVGVTRADGTGLIAPGTATAGATDAPRTVALTPAQTATLDVLVATWTDAGGGTATTLHEIVGGFYFTIREARSGEGRLDDVDQYPDAVLMDARRAVEDEFESICGVAFVPRYRRVRVTSNWSSTLIMPDPMVRTVRTVRAYSSSTGYTVFDAAALAALVVADSGVVTYDTGGFTGCYGNVVEYEHGFDRPPADVKRQALTRLREVVNESVSPIPGRAQSYTSPEGTVVFSLIPGGPGGRRTGNPNIDAVLARHAWPDAPFA